MSASPGRFRLVSLAVTILLSASFAHADVTLPAIFSEHMVLEKSGKVPIWGKAGPGEAVTVTLGEQTAKAVAGQDGKWSASLDLSQSAPGPFQLVVTGKNTLTVSDVLVGEVWLASGQSNMEWRLDKLANDEAVKAAENPQLRVFTVTRVASETPVDDVKGQWLVATPANAGVFTAVGYFFGDVLQKELKTPVGIINTSWGGTPSEAWTSVEGLSKDPTLKESAVRLPQQDKANRAAAAAFTEAVVKWLKDSGRIIEMPATGAAAFAGVEASPDGWVDVAAEKGLPEGTPRNGVIWLRAEVNLTAQQILSPLRLEFYDYGAVETVYWNGKQVGRTTYDKYPGEGARRRYDLPKDVLKEGANVLAIRVYAPLAPLAKLPRIQIGSGVVNWKARVEKELPPADAAQLAALPAAPKQFASQQNLPAMLFNGMLNPLIPYAISGVIWYQGEANAGRAVQYRTAFPLLIEDWRARWQQGDIPFYFCQLANFMDKKSAPAESNWAELREAQSMTLKLPKTGQAVLIDIGDAQDIHPRNKSEVGARLARIALANDYGRKIAYSGPMYQSMKVEGGKVRLTFSHTDGGLVAKPLPETYILKSAVGTTAPLKPLKPGSELQGFQICGEDKAWVWADAKIDGDSVLVWSEQVPNPVAVRYAWADNPTCNLYNGAGLPASPFRTDDFPANTAGKKY